MNSSPAKYIVGPNSSDSHQAAHSWAALIVRFARLRTYDHEQVTKLDDRKLSISLDDAAIDPVRERSPLLLTSSLVSFSVSESKSSHVGSANLRLAPSARFDRLICAGDWVFLWAWDNLEDSERVLKNIRAIVRADPTDSSFREVNGFRDGLRFVGRCNSPRLDDNVDPQFGIRQTVYDLTAVAFSELDSKIYFGPSYRPSPAGGGNISGGQLAQQNALAGNLVDAKIGEALPMSVEDHFVQWSSIFLGAGPGAASKGFAPDAAAAVSLDFANRSQNELILTPNDAFLVPRTVARLLGINTTQPKYADLLNTFCGVQKPRTAFPAMNQPAALVPASKSTPSGMFLPRYQSFDGGSIWELLSRYSNEPINEMFTSLRLDATLAVRPSLILRQTPFTSKLAARGFTQAGLATTAFAELPRWVLHPGLVQGCRHGASDSLRVNFVSIQASDNLRTTNGLLGLFSNSVAPPMADMADIKRTGLRPYVRSVNSDLTGILQKGRNVGVLLGRVWTGFMADILFPGHLKHSGHIACHGIQLPVPVGDNIEYEDIVYHIESRVDTASIDEQGRKIWRTVFTVSNGISVATDHVDDDVMPHEQGSEHLDKAWAIDVDAGTDSGDVAHEGEIDFSEAEARLRGEVFSSAKDQRRQTEVQTNATGFVKGRIDLGMDQG